MRMLIFNIHRCLIPSTAKKARKAGDRPISIMKRNEMIGKAARPITAMVAGDTFQMGLSFTCSVNFSTEALSFTLYPVHSTIRIMLIHNLWIVLVKLTSDLCVFFDPVQPFDHRIILHLIPWSFNSKIQSQSYSLNFFAVLTSNLGVFFDSGQPFDHSIILHLIPWSFNNKIQSHSYSLNFFCSTYK